MIPSKIKWPGFIRTVFQQCCPLKVELLNSRTINVFEDAMHLHRCEVKLLIQVKREENHGELGELNLHQTIIRGSVF